MRLQLITWPYLFYIFILTWPRPGSGCGGCGSFHGPHTLYRDIVTVATPRTVRTVCYVSLRTPTCHLVKPDGAWAWPADTHHKPVSVAKHGTHHPVKECRCIMHKLVVVIGQVILGCKPRFRNSIYVKFIVNIFICTYIPICIFIYILSLPE